jgi:phosphatidylglycerophosphate synthase
MAETPISRLRERFVESRTIYRQNRELRRSVLGLWGISTAILAIICLLVLLLHDRRLGIELFAWTEFIIICYSLFVLSNLTLCRDPHGELKRSFQLANKFTAIRIFLVAPIMVLLFRGYPIWGIILYFISGLTDVADGFAARRLNQTTLIGVMLDPVGDIMSTGGVFLFLWIRGEVPSWLFLILVIRYTQFFTGLAALAMLQALPTLHATITGKVVGVIQAAAILYLLLAQALPALLPYREINILLFPALGVSFFLVIVSQTVIGWKALRRRT